MPIKIGYTALYYVDSDGNKAAKDSEGFFKDEYNEGSVLWNLGLSWWDDVDKFVGEDNYMGQDGIEQFIQMLEEAEPKPRPEAVESYTNQFGDEGMDELYKDLENGKNKLLRFLNGSLEKGFRVFVQT